MSRLGEAGQMSVDGGRYGAGMTEVNLNLPEVLPLFEQVSGVTVAQSVNVTVLFDTAFFESAAESQLKGGPAHGPGCSGSSFAPVAFGREEQVIAMASPLLTQQFQSAPG